ncbi:MAG: pknB 3 [Nocardioides sp.]|nr:pknB 3 [Nocardioides sp.]
MPDHPRLVGGRYELREVLGRGGMAVVRRAYDHVLDRDVAIKLLHTDDALDRERFASEARLLALLNHENVVAVLDAGVEADTTTTGSPGRPWLALELVRGETLAARLAGVRPDPADLARIGSQIAAALAHAHSHAVVHRDVKPSNVLVDEAGRARLTDFGIARLVDGGTSLTMTGHTIGTAAFLAPEQVAGGAVTTATDVYALGLVLLEALTGRREYDGPPVEAALARLHRSPLVPVSLPTGWPALIAAMTVSDPAARPGADAVSRRLGELSQRTTAPAGVPDDDATTAVPLAGAAALGGATVLPFPAPAAANGPTFPPPPYPPAVPPRETTRAPRRRLLVTIAAAATLALGVPVAIGVGDGGADPASATADTRTVRAPKATTATSEPAAPTTRTPVEEVVQTSAPKDPAPRTQDRRPAPTKQAGGNGGGPKAKGGKAKGKAKAAGKGGGSKGKSQGKSKGKGKGKGKG